MHVYGLCGLFLFVDLAFFGANIVKFAQGGWFPIVVAIGIFTLMSTWKRGRVRLVAHHGGELPADRAVPQRRREAAVHAGARARRSS